MKCVKKGSVAKRVSDARASRLDQGWEYCSKTEWRAHKGKAEVEDANI